MICPSCSGFGNVKGEHCSSCNGRGITEPAKPATTQFTPRYPGAASRPVPAKHALIQPIAAPQRSGSLPPFVLGTVRTTIVVLGEGPSVIATIRSALASPDQTLEVLFVDDGSTDETAKLAATISDPRFLLLRRPWKSGKAKELGIAQASGAKIVFLNAGENA